MGAITLFPVSSTAVAGTAIQTDLHDCCLQLPINGLWVADIITNNVPVVSGATQDNLTPGYGVGSTVYIDLDGDWIFVGQAIRYGVWRNSIRMRVVGGSLGFGQFPGESLARVQASWGSLILALINQTTPYLSGALGSGTFFTGSNAFTLSLSGSRLSSELMGFLTNQINQDLWFATNSGQFGTNAPETPAQLISGGVQSFLNWRILPLSKTLNPTMATGGALASYPIVCVTWDWNLSTFVLDQIIPNPGATYLVDVQSTGQQPTLATANQAYPASVGSNPGYTTVDGTATLRDIAPERGIESYGVTYPVLLPGNWYNSPMVNYASGSTGELVQALDVTYRFSSNKLQMTVRSRSAPLIGDGVSAYIQYNGGVNSTPTAGGTW